MFVFVKLFIWDICNFSLQHLFIGVVHVNKNQPLRQAKAMNLIQLRQQGWRSGLSAPVWKPWVCRSPPGKSVPSFLQQNNSNTLKLPISPFSLTLRDKYEGEKKGWERASVGSGGRRRLGQQDDLQPPSVWALQERFALTPSQPTAKGHVDPTKRLAWSLRPEPHVRQAGRAVGSDWLR